MFLVQNLSAERLLGWTEKWRKLQPVSDSLPSAPLYIIAGMRLCVLSWHGSLSVWPCVQCVFACTCEYEDDSHTWRLYWLNLCELCDGSQAACWLLVGLSPPGDGWHRIRQKLLEQNEKQEKQNCVTSSCWWFWIEAALTRGPTWRRSYLWDGPTRNHHPYRRVCQNQLSRLRSAVLGVQVKATIRRFKNNLKYFEFLTLRYNTVECYCCIDTFDNLSWLKLSCSFPVFFYLWQWMRSSISWSNTLWRLLYTCVFTLK